MSSVHTVICILEAKPEKEDELKKALLKVAALSRAEKTCVNYRLHQDQTNPTNFILYENWVSKEAHQKQFEKPYISELSMQLDDLLEKPYQYYFADEIE